jgi:hypothetical protein
VVVGQDEDMAICPTCRTFIASPCKVRQTLPRGIFIFVGWNIFGAHEYYLSASKYSFWGISEYSGYIATVG